MNRPDFTAKNALKIAEVKLSSCGLQKKIAIAELQLRSNISLKVAELRLRTQKKVTRAHLCYLSICIYWYNLNIYIYICCRFNIYICIYLFSLISKR
jgi:hypothetical protein